MLTHCTVFNARPRAIGLRKTTPFLWIAIVLLPAFFLFSSEGLAQDDAPWSGLFAVPGVDASVRRVAYGNSGRLYAYGTFRIPDPDGTWKEYALAIWDGTEWTIEAPGGLGGISPAVFDMCIEGSEVIVAGQFSSIGGVSANNIARWNGQQWSALGSGTNGQVNALGSNGNGDVFVGGAFSVAGGVTANNIATWDGFNWVAMEEAGGGAQGVNGAVTDIFVTTAAVYLCGNFSIAGGSTNVSGGAKWAPNVGWQRIWDPTAFSPRTPQYLAVWGSDVYVSGSFTQPVKGIGKWNGSAWDSLGAGASGTILLELTSGGQLFAAGQFFDITSAVAEWDGLQWKQLGAAAQTDLLDMTSGGGNLYIVDQYRAIPGIVHNSIGQWNGSEWSGLGAGIGTLPGLGGSGVQDLATYDGALVAGGIFKTAGMDSINALAAWDGSRWSSFGDAFTASTDEIRAIVSDGNSLYVGGRFANVNSMTANSLALWNGSNWETLGSGLTYFGTPGTIHDLLLIGSDLYACGQFNAPGTFNNGGLARWNGSTWESVGGFGTSLTVFDMATDGTNLFVSALGVSQWNGSAWSDLPSVAGPFPLGVWALASSGGNLYAGGKFTSAGGVSANNIARWDGSAWHAMGDGLNGTVYEILVNGSDVYAAGAFTMSGTDTIRGIARWDGAQWWSLGRGLHRWYPSDVEAIGEGYALLPRPEGLYVGGYFSHAGGLYANNISLWSDFVSGVERTSDESLPQGFALEQNFPNPFNPATQFSFRLAAAGHTTLAVFDLLGREVARIVDEPLDVGSYTVTFDAAGLATGTYVYRLTVGEFSVVRKMVLVR